MRLVLVRHGRPDEADEGRPHDPPLRAEGRTQAEAVATQLAWEGITRVIASPLRRARETLRALGPTEWRRFLQDPLAFLGCDAAAFRSSVLGALGDLAAQAPGGRVAVFTHGLVINLVLSHILGLERIVHFQPGYASLTRLGVRAAGRFDIISVNESGHHAPAAATEPA